MRFFPAILVVTFSVILPHADSFAQQSQPAAPQADRELAGRIERLVRQLDDDRAAQRDEAEKELLALAGTSMQTSRRLLDVLPEPSEQMPLALRDRLARIRREIEDRAAKAAVAATAITLPAGDKPLADVIKSIESQTGNRLLDKRQQFGGQENEPITVSIAVDNEPFWTAVDRILDAAKLSVYNFGGEEGLTLMPRAPDDGPRSGRAAYSGPFRLEILEVQAQRNLRQPDRKSLKLQLEVAWEPRLRPIALSQPLADVAAVDDAGNPIAAEQADAVLDIEVLSGTQAAEIILPFRLPPRSVTRIASLRGKLKALVPGQQVQFKFDDLANAKGKTQRRGGVQVTVDEVRKNNVVWEVHMRFKLDEPNNSLQSHRGWVFQNVSYLQDAAGQRIDQVAFETTLQTADEVGIAYVFDLPEGKGLEGLTWVYETPAAIVELPVEYQIKGIDLP
jgi:hypothetical protein